jgi:2,3-bisphosphoglycerate-dependent phosphoglycerate mutase
MLLVLVRHGATAWSERGRLTGWADIPLNGRGRDQARLLRRRLGGPFDSVWSSDLLRAAETARLAVGEARLDRRIRELDFGSIEGATWVSLPEGIRTQLLGFDGFQAPGGESVADLRSRVLDFVDELGPGTHLLVTHGGVIRALLRLGARDVIVRPGDVVELGLVGDGATERPQPGRPRGEDVPKPHPLPAGLRWWVRRLGS